MSKERNKLRDAKRFKNVKELMLNTVELYGDNIAYVTKVKKDKNDIQYINHTYKDLLNDIFCFGTGLYKLGLKNSRVAVCGRNRYEWVVSHLSNLFGGIVSVPAYETLMEKRTDIPQLSYVAGRPPVAEFNLWLEEHEN